MTVDEIRPETAVPHFDAIVVGAGINGLYQLYRLREIGMSVRVLEAGGDVGGTWYWNRYPGARLDSESYSYGYFFSKELLHEWSWSEEFVGQPELERYLQYATEKFGLREDIDFDARVTSTVFDEQRNIWTLTTEAGAQYTAQFVIASTGILSSPIKPSIPDEDVFAGQLLHTALWPADEPDLDGKRIAVIGTGSSGIQIIQELGPRAAHLTVFQRTPNWATPLNNSPIDAERAAEIRDTIDDIYAATQASSGCFVTDSRPQSTWDVTPEERRAYYEELWNAPGLAMSVRNFNDFLTDRAANDAVVEFLSEKIRQRVDDPETARKLIPTHGFAEKRPPLETGYYEVFNQDNVRLVNLGEEPIVSFTQTGLQTAAGHVDVDVVIYATGFDSMTGSFVRLGVEGRDGIPLTEWWAQGPRTYAGAMVHHFPNLFLMGPQGVGGNFPRCAEGLADWITDTLSHLRSAGVSTIEPTDTAEAEWVDMINETVTFTLMRDSQSWIWGSNVEGKARGSFTAYLAPQPMLREKWSEIAAHGYEGFALSGSDAEPQAETAAALAEGPTIPA